VYRVSKADIANIFKVDGLFVLSHVCIKVSLIAHDSDRPIANSMTGRYSESGTCLVLPHKNLAGWSTYIKM